MKKKISIVNRLVRYFLGVALLTWAIAGGPTWTFLGILLIFSGSFGVTIRPF